MNDTTITLHSPGYNVTMLVDGLLCLDRNQILARWKVTSSDLQRRIERYQPATFVYTNRHLYLASSVVTMMEPYAER